MFEEEDDEFDELIDKLMKCRKEIKDPITDEQTEEMEEIFSKESLGGLEVEAEVFQIGEDEDGYFVLSNVSPIDNNPKKAYYFILRNESFRTNRKPQYKIDYISEFSEEENEDLEAELYNIGTAMNLVSCMNLICRHWRMMINLDD